MDLHGAAPQWLPFAPFTSGKMVAITAAAGHLYGATAKGTEANPGWQLIKKTIGDVTGAIYNPLTDPVRTPPHPSPCVRLGSGVSHRAGPRGRHRPAGFRAVPRVANGWPMCSTCSGR